MSNLEEFRVAIDKNALFGIVPNPNAVGPKKTREKGVRMPG